MKKSDTLTKDYGVMLKKILGGQSKEFIDTDTLAFFHKEAPAPKDAPNNIVITEHQSIEGGIKGKCQSNVKNLGTKYDFTWKINEENGQFIYNLTVKDYYGSGIDLVSKGEVVIENLGQISLKVLECKKVISDKLFKQVSDLHKKYFNGAFKKNQFKDWDGKEDYETWFLRMRNSYVGVVPFKQLLETKYYDYYMVVPNDLSTSEELGNIKPYHFAFNVLAVFDIEFFIKLFDVKITGATEGVFSYIEDGIDYSIKVNRHNGVLKQSSVPDNLKGKITNIRELGMLKLKKPISSYTITHRRAYTPSAYEKEDPKLKSKYDDELYRLWFFKD